MFGRIVRVSKMIAALQEKRVGKKEFYAYALISIVLFAIMGYVLVSDITGVTDGKTLYHPEMLFWVEQISLILCTILMFVVAYWANKSGDNKDYWYRLFSISIPISIRLMLMAFVAVFVFASFGLVSYEKFRYPDVILIAVLDIYGIYLTWHSMRLIATNSQTPLE